MPLLLVFLLVFVACLFVLALFLTAERYLGVVAITWHGEMVNCGGEVALRVVRR